MTPSFLPDSPILAPPCLIMYQSSEMVGEDRLIFQPLAPGLLQISKEKYSPSGGMNQSLWRRGSIRNRARISPAMSLLLACEWLHVQLHCPHWPVNSSPDNSPQDYCWDKMKGKNWHKEMWKQKLTGYLGHLQCARVPECWQVGRGVVLLCSCCLSPVPDARCVVLW